MTVIRGATTVEQDEKEEIQRAVKELLLQIENRNGLKREEILSIVFSSTSDIHSYYPAKAAREAGFENCSLFSAMEPDIEGGLKLCIRVMLFVEKNLVVHHVYLRGARILRKDISQKINIAIDGPAGSGKSTIAKRIAQDYHILYLDTGAMYRACALKALLAHADIQSESAICDLMRELSHDIRYENGRQLTLLDGKDVSEEIREPQVSMAASTVSKYKCVRLKMVEKQREIAGETSCVLDGRDIGTYVLPDADFKFFLTASAEVRARRRCFELQAKGHEVNFEALKAEIAARDEQDSTREFAPLKRAEDAILIDTSDMSIEEVVSKLKSKMQENI
ncbi:MAG: (d)CMP kinase [Clostridia bacterium]|nr:(d)CMP kinase [Clostridia bacterium]